MSLYEAQNTRYSLEEKFMDSHHSMEGCLLDIVSHHYTLLYWDTC